MSKYTPEELREMAREVVRARNRNDERFLGLVIEVAGRSGMTANEVWERIVALADMGEMPTIEG